MKTVLTIAGSDCSGGAGIQADIKTITAHKLYAMSAITALTAQNTTGVYGIEETSPEFLAKQLDCIFQDIKPDAVKIGMVSNRELINVIAEKLKIYKATNIVVDPVMVSTSGSSLVNENGKLAMIESLFPLATVITPNIPEAEVLSGLQIKNESDMIKAAQKISTLTTSGILLKGGHSINDANDLFFEKDEYEWFHQKRVNNNNTHGTGCTLSSAIACGLASGKSTRDSIKAAKQFITGALEAMLDLGVGSGPLDHMYAIPAR